MKYTVTNKGIDSFVIQDENGYDLSKDQIRNLIEKAERCDILQRRVDQAAMICTLYDHGKYETKKSLMEQIFKSRCMLDDVRTHYSVSLALSKEHEDYHKELSEEIDFIWEHIKDWRYVDCPKCGGAVLNHSNTKCFLDTLKEKGIIK